MPSASPTLRLLLAAGLCVVPACEGRSEPEAASAPASALPDPAPEIPLASWMYFSDGKIEISLRPGEPGAIWIGSTPLPFEGEWVPRGKGAPKLEGRLGGAHGPELATGPNGALRVNCQGTMRQYFRAPDREQARTAGPPPPERSLAQTCRLLGL